MIFKQERHDKPLKKLLSNFKGYYKQLILGPTFKLAEAILELFIPVLMADIIDTGIKSGDINYIISRGLFMLLLGGVGLVLAVICQYYAAVCAFGFGASLRKQMYKHVFSLSQKEHIQLGSSTLITRISNDVTQVQTGINMAIRLASRAPLLIIGSAVMALIINFKIGVIFIIFIPIVLIIIYAIMKKSLPYYTSIQNKQDGVTQIVGENLSGARVIRAFSKQTAQIEGFNENYDELTKLNITAGKISTLLNPLLNILVNVAIVIILWLGGNFVNTGVILQGELFALVNYMTQTLLALIALSVVVVMCTRGISSAKRVIDILNIESTMQNPKQSATQTESAQGESELVKFENVDFKYNKGGDAALTDISFTIKKGQSVGIIGGTGSGKTTLLRLLLRDFDVTSGEIKVSGVNVKHFTLKDLRKKIAIVPQSATLFSGTIRSNLCAAKKGASDEEMWQALTIAQGEQFVKGKKAGLDEPVLEGGKNLSGGQKQRLTIARAILAQPEILILDDAASALDFATEAKLRKALKLYTQKCTVITVSQRAHSIKQAKQILVLDDGCLVGCGTHENLLETCEVYKEICVSQGVVEEHLVQAQAKTQESTNVGAQGQAGDKL